MGLVRLHALASIAAMGKPTQRALKVLEGGEFYLAIRAEEEEFSCWEFMDPAFYVHEVTGKVVLSNFSGTPLVEVGTFCVKLVDAEGALCQGVSVHTTFDIQQETWSFFEELVDGPFPWRFKDRVLKALGCEFEVVPLGVTILSRLEIYPEYRGRDYGLAAVKCMMQRYRMGAGLIVMKPFPLQFEGLSQSSSRSGASTPTPPTSERARKSCGRTRAASGSRTYREPSSWLSRRSRVSVRRSRIDGIRSNA
jgi:hypothetical protein